MQKEEPFRTSMAVKQGLGLAKFHGEESGALAVGEGHSGTSCWCWTLPVEENTHWLALLHSCESGKRDCFTQKRWECIYREWHFSFYQYKVLTRLLEEKLSQEFHTAITDWHVLWMHWRMPWSQGRQRDKLWTSKSWTERDRRRGKLACKAWDGGEGRVRWGKPGSHEVSGFRMPEVLLTAVAILMQRRCSHVAGKVCSYQLWLPSKF